MSARRTNPLMSIVHGLIEFVAVFPLLFILSILLFQEPIFYSWLLLLIGFFIFFTLLKRYVSNRWYLIILAAVLAICVSFLIATTIWVVLISVMFCFIAALRGIQHAESDWDNLISSNFFWMISLPAYVVAAITFDYVEELSPYTYVISYMGFLFLFMVLFVTNRQHLETETLAKEKKKVNKEIIRLNRFYLMIMLLLVYLITHFQVVEAAFMKVISIIVEGFKWLATLFPGDTSTEGESLQPGSLSMMEEIEQNTSGSAEWIEKLVLIIGIILVVLLGYILFKKMRKFIKKVMVYLWDLIKRVTGKQPSEEQADFMDEKENLFDWKKWRKENKDKVLQTFQNITKRAPAFYQLTKEEKVHFLYRYLAKKVKKHEKWYDSLTAHEVLALAKKETQLQQLKSWYDATRYGNQSLPDHVESEINQLWEELQEEK